MTDRDDGTHLPLGLIFQHLPTAAGRSRIATQKAFDLPRRRKEARAAAEREAHIEHLVELRVLQQRLADERPTPDTEPAPMSLNDAIRSRLATTTYTPNKEK